MVEKELRNEVERTGTGVILAIRDCRVKDSQALALELEVHMVDDRPMKEVAKDPTLSQMFAGIVTSVMQSPEFMDTSQQQVVDPAGMAAAMGATLQQRLRKILVDRAGGDEA